MRCLDDCSRNNAAAVRMISAMPAVIPAAIAVEAELGAAAWYGLRILRLPLAERPVFFDDFHQIDENVLRAQAGILCQPFDDTAVERLLLLDATGIAHRHLDEHEVVRAHDVEVFGIVDEAVLVVLGDGGEKVLLRYVEGFAQRPIDVVGDGAPVAGRLARAQRNANERHGTPPSQGPLPAAFSRWI